MLRIILLVILVLILVGGLTTMTDAGLFTEPAITAGEGSGSSS